MRKKNYLSTFRNDKEYQRYYKEASDLLDIAMKVTEARKRRRLTQYQLAKKVGMPQSQIARIESGNHNVTLVTFNRVLNALKLKVRLAS